MTPVQKAKIGAHFILSSPPGQVDEVVADVRKLVPEEALDDAKIAAIAYKYNTDQLVLVDSPAGGKMVLSTDGQVDATHFIDTAARKVVGVNHTTRTADAADVKDVTDEMDASVEEARAAVHGAVKAYADLFYKDGGAEVYGVDGALKIVVSGQTANLRNFWSGSWRSWWTVTLKGGEAAEISGRVRILTHYFENGNVQMHTLKEVEATPLGAGSGEALATAVKDAISKAEGDLHTSLGEMYTSMTTTLKDVRRFLPLSGKPMEWNVAAHKLRNTLVTDSSKKT